MGGVILHGVLMQEQNPAHFARRVCGKSKAPMQGVRPLHEPPCLTTWSHRAVFFFLPEL